MNLNIKLILSIIATFLVLYIINKFNILASILTSGMIAFLGYILLYKCCTILCENKKIGIDELIEKYGINGITRIILETFKLFAEKIYSLVSKYNIIEVIFKRFFFQNDCQKPIMKEDINKDKILMFEYLVNIIDKKKHTDNFKNCVENIWQDRWSFFAHSSYIGKILNKIGDLCYKNNLPIITFLITYYDGTLSKGCFQEKWKSGTYGWETSKLNYDFKDDFIEVKDYIKKIVEHKEEYKNLLNSLKQHIHETEN